MIFTLSWVSSWVFPYMTQLYTCNSAWEFSPPSYVPAVPKLPVCVRATSCSSVCDDKYDKGQRKWPRNLYSTDISSQLFQFSLRLYFVLFLITDTVQNNALCTSLGCLSAFTWSAESTSCTQKTKGIVTFWPCSSLYLICY